MVLELARGILTPFFGTALGAGAVFFTRRAPGEGVQRGLMGFAAGVMTAASVWSLLLPALALSEGLGPWAFLPAALGFWAGVGFLLILDVAVPHLHRLSREAEGPRAALTGNAMLILAVTLHNLPEGMAVGVLYAARLAGAPEVTAAGALALSLGVALQNLPEGAIISLPLRGEGMGRGRSFLWGVLSGAVEPLGAVLTLLAARQVTALLPALLGFAAGAMLYAVVEELIPELCRTKHAPPGSLFFAAGFTVMMALDVALG